MAIENISDTARWVAAFRAQESERPDALFRDPFARMLAGDRGFELVRKLSFSHTLQWTMSVRTRVLDEMLLEAVQSGCDAVVNLAAGLDTRPQRMTFPKSLTWIEADLPGILEHKEAVLGPAPSSCKLERVRVDLAVDSERAALLERVGREFKRAVVLTEGLLVYLPEAAVANLARELRAQPGISGWMMDLVSALGLRVIQVAWNRQLAAGDAKMQFGPLGGAQWFARHGWRVRTERRFDDEGARFRRGAWNQIWGQLSRAIPSPVRGWVGDGSGLLWLER